MLPGGLASVRVVEPSTSLAQLDADVAVIVVEPGWETVPPTAELVSVLDADIAQRLDDLAGKAGGASLLTLPLGGGQAPDWVLCVSPDRALPAHVALRRAGFETAAALGGARSVAIYAAAGSGGRQAGGALVEGLLEGLHKPRAALSSPAQGRHPVSGAADACDGEVEQAVDVALAVNWCRQLVDASSSELTPTRLAATASEMAESMGLWHRTWSADDLREGGFGGICAVGRAADNEPCMVEIRTESPGPKLALVGKGVTCDTGGLQIKTEGLEWLKADMAGAAAVLAATWAAIELRVQVGLHVVIPCVENMPGPAAYRTGDIVTHRDGTTTEVWDTDAEGRLVLADAIAFARESQPAAIIDVATLTGGLALGPQLWALLSNSDRLADALLAAAADAGDPAWRLPLWPGYNSALASELADRGNVGRLGAIGTAGTVLGGLFLASFPGDTPWAHIDIAGTAFRPAPCPPFPAGATGAGTAAVIRFLQSYAAAA
jgi:leucyl aminopeptidase